MTIIVLISFLIFSFVNVQAKPPLEDTGWIEPDMIDSKDPTTFQEIIFMGKEERTMFDGRDNDGQINDTPFIFNAIYENGLVIEIMVNSEFSSKRALRSALLYAEAVGRLPIILLQHLKKINIHKKQPEYPAAAVGRNIIIYANYFLGNEKKFIEEILLHELGHVALQNVSSSKDWIKAQEADGEFISEYARNHPTSEDVTESFQAWFILRYRTDRLSSPRSYKKRIMKAIPNRIKYFDDQSFNMYPMQN